MSPEQLRSLTSFALIRYQVRGALETAHSVGLDSHPAVKAEYYKVAELLIEMDERGKAAFGEANYVHAVMADGGEPQ